MDEWDQLGALIGLAAVFLAALLALGVLTRPWHWFWRTLPLVAWIAFVAQTGALGPTLLFIAQFSTTAELRIVWWQLKRRAALRAGSEQTGLAAWQFSLGDGLLAVPIFAFVLAILASRRLAADWRGEANGALWALIGVAAGLVTCLAIWAIDVPHTKLLSEVARRRGHRFAIGCVRCAVALIGTLLLGGLVAGFYKACCETPPIMIGTFAVQSEYSWPRTLTAAAFLLGLAEMVWLGLWWLGSQSPVADGAQAHGETAATPRRVPFRLIAQRVALVALLVPLAGSVGWLWWQLVMPVALPADLPGGENEARLDALAGRLDWSALPSQDLDVATPAVCQSFALLNANRLAAAHDILAGPCAVVVDYHEPFPGIAGAMRLRELARAFVLQSRAAAERDDPAEAVSAGLDCFRAGSRGLRGGMLFHRLIGTALESVALDVFADLAPTLGREQSRRLDAALAAAERDRERPGDVLARVRVGHDGQRLVWQAASSVGGRRVRQGAVWRRPDRSRQSRAGSAPSRPHRAGNSRLSARRGQFSHVAANARAGMAQRSSPRSIQRPGPRLPRRCRGLPALQRRKRRNRRRRNPRRMHRDDAGDRLLA